ARRPSHAPELDEKTLGGWPIALEGRARIGLPSRDELGRQSLHAPEVDVSDTGVGEEQIRGLGVRVEEALKTGLDVEVPNARAGAITFGARCPGDERVEFLSDDELGGQDVHGGKSILDTRHADVRSIAKERLERALVVRLGDVVALLEEALAHL